MPLVEALLFMARRTAHECQRPSFNMRHNPVDNVLVVMRQVAFGNPLIGIQNAVGMSKLYAGDFIGLIWLEGLSSLKPLNEG